MALSEVCSLSNFSFFKAAKNPLFNAECDKIDSFNPYSIAAPPFENAVENFNKIAEHSAQTGTQIKFDHGTTTLGFKYQGGVLLAVDSRATGGAFIGSQSMKKIVEINKYMLGTLAGGAADCVYWDRVLSKECRLHELRNKEHISVAAASKIMSNISHEYKGMGLSMGMMLAGFDKRGASLYYIDSDASRTPGNVFSVGSGSIYAFGVLDSGYKWDLTDEEAQELGRRAIYHATYKDAYSGGMVRVYQIKSDGWVNISNTDCMDLHYKYADEKLAGSA